MVEVRRRLKAELFAFASGNDLLEVVGANHGIHFRQALFDLTSKAFYKTPGNHKPLGLAMLLILAHLDNRIDGLLLSRIDKAASVDDNDIRIIGRRCELMTMRGKLPHHHF